MTARKVRRQLTAATLTGLTLVGAVTLIGRRPQPRYRLAVQLTTPRMIREAGLELGR